MDCICVRLVSRLVIDPASNTVVTTPFVRFAHGGSTKSWHHDQQVTASVKLDGSLAIVFLWQGQLRVPTRRRMTSEQACWASDWLSSHSNVDAFKDGWTYLFEFLGRDNVVATSYATRGLVLLMAFDAEGCELERGDQEAVATELNVLSLKAPSVTFNGFVQTISICRAARVFFTCQLLKAGS